MGLSILYVTQKRKGAENTNRFEHSREQE